MAQLGDGDRTWRRGLLRGRPKAYGQRPGLRSHGHKFLMHHFSLQGGNTQGILSGVNIAELKRAVKPNIRTMSVIDMADLAEFDPVFVKWEWHITSKFTF